MHLQNGSIKKHTQDSHGATLTRDVIVNNTIMLDRISDYRRLQYLEAIYINVYKPNINIQGGVMPITLPSDREARQTNIE